ncbi:MAG: sigma-70 family RNA polymerase sigma factor [Caldilineales bacterium]|nr:sigma-70 family RNA polymerase sigma factor [Caldilineales bacterium]MDW8319048.1 sigma-70 family RNA polymerase sigma factor [Anaerolineae bacterium]
MLSSPHDEAALVKRAANGDADAFGTLYLRHLDAIYRYVRLRVGNARDAEDLTEQVFLKAWEALPSYRQRGLPFASWLYRIAHNAVVDFHRRPSPEVPLAAADHPSGGGSSRGAGALDTIIQESEVAALAEAIRKLPEEQQQVIVLRFIEGLSHAEVARIINKSQGACRVIQHRALSALHRLLTEADHDQV